MQSVLTKYGLDTVSASCVATAITEEICRSSEMFFTSNELNAFSTKSLICENKNVRIQSFDFNPKVET